MFQNSLFSDIMKVLFSKKPDFLQDLNIATDRSIGGNLRVRIVDYYSYSEVASV